MSPGKTLIGFLILAAAFVFVFPDVAIGPGRVSKGHFSVANKCWTCHQPFRGAGFEKCTSCHKISDIGRITTTGEPLPQTGKKRRVLFHAGLADPDCNSCHIIHVGERHSKSVSTFRHDVLADTIKSNCGSCHNEDKPLDTLHGQVSQQCSACHKTSGWRPATFDHNAYFRFDSNHPTRCNTCHMDAGSYSTYTCYGCHDHTPANMAAKHAEEGIRNLEKCARCHRTGNAEELENKLRD